MLKQVVRIVTTSFERVNIVNSPLILANLRTDVFVSTPTLLSGSFNLFFAQS
jgi:hypothetical protein